MKFQNCEDFKAFPEPIWFQEFEAVGYFPYETASIYNSVDDVCPSRSLFSSIEAELRKNGISDNKYVVIFKDKLHFGTSDFAIFFKDAYCKIGDWDSVRGYGGQKLG